MQMLDAYTDVQLLFAGKTFSWFRGTHRTDGKAQLFKTFSSDYPKSEDFLFFERDFAISEHLISDFALHSEGMLQAEKRTYIQYPDFSGLPLLHYLRTQNRLYLDPQGAIRVFAAMVEAVGNLHKNKLVHRGLNPSAILFDPESGEIRITGFGFSTFNDAEKLEINIDLYDVENALAYIAPEQTGRLRAEVDQRSDYYALGIVFYECLSRQLPFPYSDSISLIYSHIAQEAPSVRTLNPAVPAALAAIVHKMMAKNGRDRYQSARGILADLQKCSDLLGLGDEERMFPLGGGDISDSLYLPEHSFGRENELDQIVDILENPSPDRFSAIWISGPSGMGKTTLMQAVKARLAGRSDIYFISGTYKNYSRNVPFAGISEALARLAEQFLSAPTEILHQKRQKLQAALGNQGKLATDLIPELELLLGVQQPIDSDITPDEAENRLKTALLNLITAMQDEGRRMVLFLDDIHLADEPSLAFLKTLSQHNFNRSLVLIGASVATFQAEDAQLAALQEVFQQNANTFIIDLKPLSVENLQQLIAQILPGAQASVQDVVRQLHAKTNGIPIFIIEFLHLAHKQGVLFFDDSNNSWCWQEQGLEHLPLSDNVADLMLGKVQELPVETLELLKLAACIGPRFSLDHLSVLAQKTEDACWLALTEALLHAFVIVDRPLNFGADEPETLAVNALGNQKKLLAFSHDRIQQALYSLIPEAEKSQIHHQIASHQLQSLAQKDIDRNLFDIAQHLHNGLAILAKDAPNEKAVQVFAAAASRAKLNSSYGLAYTYFSDAAYLYLPEWQATTAPWYFDVSLEHLECAFLAGKSEAGEILYQQLLAKAAGSIERARILQVKAMSQLHLSNNSETYRICREALGLFGIRLPEKPSQMHLLPEIIQTRMALGNKTSDDILALPLLKNPKAQIIEALYFRCLPYALSTSKELYAIISLRMFRNTLKYGHGVFSFSGFNIYGQILALGFGQFNKGFEFTRLGLLSAQKVGNNVSVGGAKFGLAICGVHTQDLITCIGIFEEAHENLNVSGNIYYASTATSSITLFCLLNGLPIAQLREKALRFQRFAYNANQPDTTQFQQGCVLFMDLLLGTLPATELKIVDPYQVYPNFSDIHAGWFYTLQMQLAFYLNQPELGIEISKNAEPDIQALFFDIMFPEFYFFRALLFERLYKQSSASKQRYYLREIRKSVAMFRKRAQFSAKNYLHKYHILNGVYLELTGKPQKALLEFEQAIVWSSKEQYLQYEAIAHQYAAQHSDAAFHLLQAYKKFEIWGAKAVCMQLLQAHPEALQGVTKKSAEHASISGSNSIDFKSVLKASQILSKEIELSKVLSSLIRITIENAGAQRGYLLVADGQGNWKVRASGTQEQREVHTQSGAPVSDQDAELALAVVNYVSRTHKAVVLEEALNDQRFALDPYVIAQRPKSIACYPILNQGQLIAILYLENNLTAGAFTPERAEVLGLLSSQAGISLQNALLFDQLNALNRAYERFVPKEFLKYLNKSQITEVKLGDHVQQEMTVMFADIRRFTILSEQLSPRENFQFINHYLGIMEPVIRKYHGFVDKYIGDAIMALFPTSAEDAVKAALEMMDKLETFNQEQQHQVHIGIGLNTGKLILGTVGGQDRMESTVISDAVNIASRIESLTKTYGVNILIGENTFLQLPNPQQFPIRLLDQVVPDGKSESIAIYEVIAGELPTVRALKMELRSTFEAALIALKMQKLDEAHALFQQIVQENPDDLPARLLLGRCGQS